jgi:tetratricopeptide (TPR) repeat protein
MKLGGGWEGIAFLNDGQYDRAITCFNKVIEKNPNDVAYSFRGEAYCEKGQYDKAISDYCKAIELNPEYAIAYNNRGLAYYRKGDYEKAWNDVYKAQNLGYKVHPGFLKALRQASGREK